MSGEYFYTLIYSLSFSELTELLGILVSLIRMIIGVVRDIILCLIGQQDKVPAHNFPTVRSFFKIFE
jgi:hypothetical protein